MARDRTVREDPNARDRPRMNVPPPQGHDLHSRRRCSAWAPTNTTRKRRPVHRVKVDGFWMDQTPVTNRQFKAFVQATGYSTLAEIAPDPNDYPGALPHMLYPASLVFTSAQPHAVDLRDWSQWWTFLRGADWRHPYGPGRSASTGSTTIRSCTSHSRRRTGLCEVGW